MTLLQSFILALVQGITEFLPISSSAHLVIFSDLFGWQGHSLFFDLMVHLGTGLALVAYFWRDLLDMVRKWKIWWFKIFIGVLPAGLAGFVLRDWFENSFRSANFALLFLLMGSLLMLGAEVFRKRIALDGVAGANDLAGLDNLDIVNLDVSAKQAFSVGLFQVLALFPGFSRSGSTISGGMLVGLKRPSAAKFSFLLSIPLILGAGLYELINAPVEVFQSSAIGSVLVGVAISFLSGLFCVNFLMKFLKNNSLIPFVVYRVFLILVILLFLF